MKILYLAELEPGGKFGGSLVEDRNLRVLKSLFDVQEICVYARGRSIKRKLLDIFSSKVPTLYSKSETNRIITIVKNSDAEI